MGDMAGKTWLSLFLKKHKTLFIRQPTGISVARALGFTKENAENCFDHLESVFQKHNYLPSGNVAETGLIFVKSKV